MLDSSANFLTATVLSISTSFQTAGGCREDNFLSSMQLDVKDFDPPPRGLCSRYSTSDLSLPCVFQSGGRPVRKSERTHILFSLSSSIVFFSLLVGISNEYLECLEIGIF